MFSSTFRIDTSTSLSALINMTLLLLFSNLGVSFLSVNPELSLNVVVTTLVNYLLGYVFSNFDLNHLLNLSFFSFRSFFSSSLTIFFFYNYISSILISFSSLILPLMTVYHLFFFMLCSIIAMPFSNFRLKRCSQWFMMRYDWLANDRMKIKYFMDERDL